MKADVVVVGGGISGLAATYWLRKNGHKVLLLEAGQRLGGNILCFRGDGMHFEQGPNSLLDNSPFTHEFLAELGLHAESVEAHPDCQKRFVLNRGQLRPVKPSLLALFRLLGVMGTLRLLREPWIKECSPADETVAAFFERRIGKKARERLVDAFVSGIFAGNSSELCVRSCFPRLFNAVQTHGSLFRAMRRLGGSGRAKTVSFRMGMERWPRALAEKIGDEAILLGARASGISNTLSGRRITFLQNGIEKTIDCRTVFICTPAHVAAGLLESHWPEDAVQALREIPYSPVVTAGVSWNETKEDLRTRAFGFLVPKAEKLSILGAVFAKSVFPALFQTPRQVSNVFLGGSGNPQVLEESDSGLASMIQRDLESVLGSVSDFKVHAIQRWKSGIPQLTVGHPERIEAVQSALESHPDIQLAGNYLAGVSLHDAVQTAFDGFRKTEEFLAQVRRLP